jgi:hypothetical protein
MQQQHHHSQWIQQKKHPQSRQHQQQRLLMSHQAGGRLAPSMPTLELSAALYMLSTPLPSLHPAKIQRLKGCLLPLLVAKITAARPGMKHRQQQQHQQCQEQPQRRTVEACWQALSQSSLQD